MTHPAARSVTSRGGAASCLGSLPSAGLAAECHPRLRLRGWPRGACSLPGRVPAGLGEQPWRWRVDPAWGSAGPGRLWRERMLAEVRGVRALRVRAGWPLAVTCVSPGGPGEGRALPGRALVQHNLQNLVLCQNTPGSLYSLGAFDPLLGLLSLPAESLRSPGEAPTQACDL